MESPQLVVHLGFFSSLNCCPMKYFIPTLNNNPLRTIISPQYCPPPATWDLSQKVIKPNYSWSGLHPMRIHQISSFTLLCRFNFHAGSQSNPPLLLVMITWSHPACLSHWTFVIVAVTGQLTSHPHQSHRLIGNDRNSETNHRIIIIIIRCGHHCTHCPYSNPPVPLLWQLNHEEE